MLFHKQATLYTLIYFYTSIILFYITVVNSFLYYIYLVEYLAIRYFKG